MLHHRVYRSLRFSPFVLAAIVCCAAAGSLTPSVCHGQQEAAWDYSPYRVLVWVLDTEQTSVAPRLADPLKEYLDYDFSALWRVDVQDTPPGPRIAALRSLEDFSYDQLTAADPVLAVRKDHPDAPRIRTANDVAAKVKRIFATPSVVENVLPRGAAIDIQPTRARWEQIILERFRELRIDPATWREMTLQMLDILEGRKVVDIAALRKTIEPMVQPEDETPLAEEKARTLRAEMEKLFETFQAIAVTDNANLHGVKDLLVTEGFTSQDAVLQSWAKDGTEALLVPRGLATELHDPDPKIIPIEIADLMGAVFDRYDKIFVVRIDSHTLPIQIETMEIDCLMRMPGPLVRRTVISEQRLVAGIGEAITKAFGPTVRIEDVGTEIVTGRVRAGGLIMDPDSPAAIHEDDWLQPALRKDDRMGDPLILEKLDWSYLHVQKADGSKLEMKMHAGRIGGLPARKNKRTHRMAFKIRPYHDNTVIRLHAQKKPDEPLQGYEFYEKNLETKEFTFVGRTDWDGRFVVEKTDHPMRLMYVKNGGAILARLPCVPGQDAMGTADIRGDDLRLQAEAYIRGIQNAIIDLVALRQLLAARIRLRLEKGKVEEARELLNALREQPTYDILSQDMRNKRKEMETNNRQQQAMINQLFDQTRTMLVKHIDEKTIRELEADVASVEGGTPYKPPAEEEE
ncbi:hypothetical protein [Roseimaritima ulvae]|uniref:Uncharacterized protein n=2 Tax=Roseimaritima ulvae TaxID=980254 RepID=A0A5B9R005_9BACT|nr:hypothetical protein [Roseimaritima ulvae]QEG43045.1 hypothetical protein UC8_50880 [Roseimaritima ulvae]